MLKIGVLALQGAFEKHAKMLERLGAAVCEVRKPQDLEACDGLIIPGGESTSMFKHVDFIQMRDKLQAFAKKKPIFGTCAGLILMSREVVGSEMHPFQFLSVSVERNAFGRQAESFEADIEIHLEKQKVKTVPALFIRAPRIRKWESSVKVLSKWQEEPILIQEGLHLGSTFHPELTTDSTIHQYFLDMVQRAKRQS